jgi:hypothetical protein
MLACYLLTKTILSNHHLCLKLSSVVLVYQDVSVSSTTLVHVGDSLVDIIHRPSLGPSLDTVVTGKLEHLGNGGSRRSDSGSTKVDVALLSA